MSTVSLLDSREQRQIKLINSNRVRHHPQLTEKQVIEDETVRTTHRDSSQRMGQYTELTETVHCGRDSTHRSLEHSPRNSLRQFTEDGTVHTVH